MGDLVKATIETLEGPKLLVKAWFNPKEYQVAKTVRWNEHQASAEDAPMVQYTTGQPKTLSVELFFDGYEDRGSSGDLGGTPSTVREACKTLIQMAEMCPDLHRPPECLFSWAEENFKGVMENVTVRYTMFLPNGTPVRATASIQMKNAKPMRGQDKANPNAKETYSPDHAKLHTLRRGETLQSIAAREYDDPGEWRRIADANGIDNPMALEPGTRLIIPPILRV